MPTGPVTGLYVYIYNRRTVEVDEEIETTALSHVGGFVLSALALFQLSVLASSRPSLPPVPSVPP